MTTVKEYLYHSLYIDFAERVSRMSHSLRAKVGAIIVKHGDREFNDDDIIAYGWNGTPSMDNNACEVDRNGELVSLEDPCGYIATDLITRSCVIHAEDNAIRKMNQKGIDGHNCTLYVTWSPCYHCATNHIIPAGIRRVVYRHEYIESKSPTRGVDALKEAGVEVFRIP